MNKRILELAKQAGLKDFFEEDLSLQEKVFVQLLVRECVEICRSEDWEDQQGWGKLYAHKIKKQLVDEE